VSIVARLQFELPTDNEPSSTNRRRRFGRPQGESSVSETKGPQALQQSLRARINTFVGSII
jgi:hypothetical protein